MRRLFSMPAENAGRAFALVLVDELVRQGMRHAVVAPGSRSTPIALALLENPDVTVHVRVDERSAAYLALGIAKASGAIVPVLCTSGTAATYFYGAVMEADLSCIPLLVLTADRPPELHGIGANQTVDQRSMFGNAVRSAPTVEVPAADPKSAVLWRRMINDVAAVCLGRQLQPPGPVHLNLPFRDPLLPVADDDGFPYDLDPEDSATQPAASLPYLSEPAPPELLELLLEARHGVIVVGGNVGDIEPVRAFAHRARWPVIAEPHSNARRPHLALRSTDALLRDRDFIPAQRPDLVVVVGRIGLSRALLEWLIFVPHVVLSVDGGYWNVTRAAELVVDRPIEVFHEFVVTPADPAWAAAWQEASDRVSAAIDDVLDAAPTLTEPRVARDVAALIPDGSALVVASSMPIRDLDLVMRPRDNIRIYANRGVSGIDGFVSTAQGVAIASDSPTFALCGDLSLLHDINGLMPSNRPRPSVTYVVINNDGGGIFSLLPQGSAVDPVAFEQLFGTPHGLSIERLAAAYDVPHVLVGTAEELAAALSSNGGLRIIEVQTDRVENAALHERLRAISP
jgi:2-succinyl-5-enolpyruvyl-6-hydroxy-3-cyclohexene-1-carboxylate synthase